MRVHGKGTVCLEAETEAKAKEVMHATEDKCLGTEAVDLELHEAGEAHVESEAEQHDALHRAAEFCMEVEAKVEHIVHAVGNTCFEAAPITSQPTQEDIFLEARGERWSALHKIRESLSRPQKDSRAHGILDSVCFQTGIIVMIMINALQMGLEVDYPDWKLTWSVCENVFTAGFTAEMVIKLRIFKCHYFHDKSNWLDGSLTILGIIDCWILGAASGSGVDLQSLSLLRILRLVRLLRIMRLVRSIKPIVLLIQGVIHTMSTVFYVFALCACISYVVAIFVTEQLGKATTNLYPGFSTDVEAIDEMDMMQQYNPYLCFGSMFASMITLFNIARGSEWTEIVRPIAVKQPIYLFIFLLFATLMSFGVMHVLLGVIVDVVTTESKKIEAMYSEEEKKKQLKNFQNLEEVLSSLDSTGDGCLDINRIDLAMQDNESLKELMRDIDLPMGWAPHELMTMLDSDGDGMITSEEFTTNFFRLLSSDDFQQICILQASINQVKNMIRKQEKKMRARHLELKADIASIKLALDVDRKKQVGGRPVRHSVETLSDTPSCIKSGGQQQYLPASPTTCNSNFWSERSATTSCTGHRRLEEALSVALMVVKECVDTELSVIKPSYESELSGFVAQSCGSLIGATEIQPLSPCRSLSIECPAAFPRATANLKDDNNGDRSDHDFDSVVPETRGCKLASATASLPRSSKSIDSAAAPLTRQHPVDLNDFPRSL